jgi:hypothetical protein
MAVSTSATDVTQLSSSNSAAEAAAAKA